jgi:hypothetical protein
MLELFLFEIDVGKKKRHKKKERERKKKKGCLRDVFLSFSLPNTNSSFFPCSLTL